MTLDKSDTRLFVAGATGYTGRALVRLGREAGLDMIAHIRPDSSRLEACREAFEEQGARVDTTPWEQEAMAQTLAEIEPSHIFFVIGTTKKRMRQEEGDAGYEAIDYGLAKLLVDAAVQAEVSARFVYLSAHGVKEGASTAYYEARWKAEEAVRDSGLSYAIARPGFISGENRQESRPMERVGAVLGDAVTGLAGALGATKFRDRYKSRDNEQMARELLTVALDPEAENRTFDSDELRRFAAASSALVLGSGNT